MTDQEFSTLVNAFVQEYRSNSLIAAFACQSGEVLVSGIRSDDGWVTINGTHVKINDEGVAESGGKLKGMSFSKAKSIKSMLYIA